MAREIARHYGWTADRVRRKIDLHRRIDVLSQCERRPAALLRLDLLRLERLIEEGALVGKDADEELDRVEQGVRRLS